MQEMFQVSLETLKMYNGCFILFLFALVYIWWEKRQTAYVWIIYSIFVIAIFLNPICTMIMVRYCVELDTYWRYLWILPYGMVIAYGATKLVESAEKKKKWFLFFLLILILITMGKNIYTFQNYERAENLYKLPQEVIEITNILEENNIVDKVALPEDLRYYVRQYDAGISVLYSRMIYHTDEGRLIEELEKREKMDANLVDQILTGKGCRCVVIYKSQDGLKAMEMLGYREIGSTEEHIVLYK